MSAGAAEPRAPPLTCRAPDGTALAYRLLEAEAPRATILFLHGWSDHMGRWLWPAERLREAGYTVCLLDLRGHGRSAGRRGHLARFAQLLSDVHAVRRSVLAPSGLPQVLLGHSLGGLAVLRYLETDPDPPVVAAVVSSPFLALGFSPPPWKLALGRLFAHLGSGLPLPMGIDPEWLSRDPEVGRAYRKDPLVHRRMTPGAWREIRGAQILVREHAERITTPLLLLVAGRDLIAEPQASLELARALSEERVTLRSYPNMMHELLNDPDREMVMGDVLAFLAGVLSGSGGAC